MTKLSENETSENDRPVGKQDALRNIANDRDDRSALLEGLSRLANDFTGVRLAVSQPSSSAGCAELFNQLAAEMDRTTPVLRRAKDTCGEPLHEAEDGKSRFFAVAELDRFSALRKRISYDRANELLADVENQITQTLPGVTICRTGRTGIEFSFLASSRADCENHLRNLCQTLRGDLDVDGYSYLLSLSIGAVQIAGGPIDERIFDQAAAALASAKDLKRHVVVCDHQTGEGQIYEHVALMRDLRYAIEHDELQLHYQPKLKTRTNEIVSVEALLRWDHPKHGLLRTDKLIDVAEETGSVRELTKWVVERALLDREYLCRANHSLRIFVNISGLLLPDRKFADWLLKTAAGMEHALGLEITETAVIDDPEIGIAHLEAFAAAGLAIAIDDYGSGLSSLAYLKRLPAHELKIDQMFVSALTESHRDPLLVRSSIDLAHALEMEVTAEGVDDAMTLSLLQVMGCDIVQGFLIAPALPRDELIAFLEEGFTHQSDFMSGLTAPTRAGGGSGS